MEDYTKEDFKKELEYYDKIVTEDGDNMFNLGYLSALEKVENLILFGVGCSTNKKIDKISELRIKQLEGQVELLTFMVDNGLGAEDMLNDITYPRS